MSHSLDALYAESKQNICSRILFEGNAPRDGGLVVLVPFVRQDGSPHYLVCLFEITEKAVAANVVPDSEPAAAVEPESKQLSFGPAIERVVSGKGDVHQRFIDFDTGKRFAAAEFFGAKDQPSPEETQQWSRNTGIDALARMFHTFFHHRAPLCTPRWPIGYRSVRLPEAPLTRLRARDESFRCTDAG